MAARLYLVPVIGTGADGDGRRPKYFSDGTVVVGDLSVMDYGFEPWMVVTADLSASDHTLVTGQPDAFGIPADLTETLKPAQVTAVKAQLEVMHTPAHWITTADTWAEVVRLVLWMWAYWQRFTAIHGGRVFIGGVTLDTTIGQLPAGARVELTAAATSLGLSTEGIGLATAIRHAMKLLGDQLNARPITLGAITV